MVESTTSTPQERIKAQGGEVRHKAKVPARQSAPESKGLDVQERLRYSCFSGEDAELLRQLEPSVRKRMNEVVDGFYEHLQGFDALVHLVPDDTVIRRLKKVLGEYVLTLTRPSHGKPDLEARRQIGRAHEQIGLAPQWYLGAYCILQELLRPIVYDHFEGDPSTAGRAMLALSKLTNLDMQLVLGAYFETRQARAVEHSEKLAAVGELAASIAHEVRNPLAGMKGALEVLRADLMQDPSKREVMDEVLNQIVRLENLVRDLLNFARPNPLNVQALDLHHLIDRSLRLLQEGVEEAGITVSRTYGPNKAPFVADPLQLEQVFLNLIGNSVQAMSGEGGTLTIITRFGSNGVDIVFRDQGKGIPPSELRQIFQPFYTTKHRGSGLGLSIVKKIVEAHNGSVMVESTEGEGTTATVRLPRIEAK